MGDTGYGETDMNVFSGPEYEKNRASPIQSNLASLLRSIPILDCRTYAQ